MMTMLILLSFRKGSRHLNRIIADLGNAHLIIGSLKIPAFPMLALINLYYAMSMVKELELLRVAQRANNYELGSTHYGQHQERMYRCYRNLVLNIASIVLILQLSITSTIYKSYQPLKDKHEEMKQKMAKAQK
eukprot:CAMPEP_0176367034 /NCGR_PEP_ID=MMETSP0126-20121128/21594_1 /TAXON_ID=141414 ORGANISM="Strombidinopsis acuminatum, Strain SPMC142" /NCGR_SAMPLE_ID=MMETSP0126 /ASSEMBLY_ACC=CAM_ASM_000229 /LENGTH=132 /DNA_ID=CAMNT_0017724687 /DNA_START=453 /DNA_END=851 /DNA_ORIENTATION=+